uniref:Uncharacterized protein n=1 Tax=Anguilla anguilla TaxID=7936 RepID=A0A0E9TNR6_ANGAN
MIIIIITTIMKR